MIIANEYNHLNAREFLIVNKSDEYAEIIECLQSVNANDYLKISCDKEKLGKVLYSQSEINRAIKEKLLRKDWEDKRIVFYVTGDEETTREIIHIHDAEEQRRILEERAVFYYSTYNQIDFQKSRIAVEVQFGKYFSVAYDLHVKHTFFYSRNDIDVGIEIIPTKQMEQRMDTGVPAFEKEVTNVIREGRTNPPIPIFIIGIEPELILSERPQDYTDEELIRILRRSDVGKFRSQVNKYRNTFNEEKAERVEWIERCLVLMEE